jgi:hypothetical protein
MGQAAHGVGGGGERERERRPEVMGERERAEVEKCKKEEQRVSFE